EHILQAYQVDIETRTNPNGPIRDAARFPDAWEVNAHEIKSGVVYKDDKVTVTLVPRPVRSSYDTSPRTIGCLQAAWGAIPRTVLRGSGPLSHHKPGLCPPKPCPGCGYTTSEGGLDDWRKARKLAHRRTVGKIVAGPK